MDTYSKFILTVIAILLTLHLVKPFVIVNEIGAQQIQSVDIPNGSVLPVRITNDTLSINMAKIDGRRIGSVELPVEVKNQTLYVRTRRDERTK
jgi:hypothetical protein